MQEAQRSFFSFFFLLLLFLFLAHPAVGITFDRRCHYDGKDPGPLSLSLGHSDISISSGR